MALRRILSLCGLWMTAFALGALVAACTGTTTTVIDSCRTDEDCRGGERCELSIGRCLCSTDEACPEGQFCNSAGSCQANAGCSDNSDCAQEGTFCDLASGRCLAGPAEQLESECGLASHCPLGAVCNGSQCVAGCFSDADCQLGDLCIDGDCYTGDGLCREDDFCGYQELCVGNQCERERGPYCRGCQAPSTVNPEPCDHPRNFCLVNSSESGGFPYFCGVDCSLGQPCPNGYVCNGILILTDRSCRSNVQCQCQPGAEFLATETSSCAVSTPCDPKTPDGLPDPNATFCVVEEHPSCPSSEALPGLCVVRRGETNGNCSCVVDEDCGADAVCVSGLCCGGQVRRDRECAVGEGRVSGFCTCATDDDCPRDACDGSSGTCAITGLPCTPGNDDCGAIPCVDGACLIGRNCAPEQGLNCSILTGN